MNSRSNNDSEPDEERANDNSERSILILFDLVPHRKWHQLAKDDEHDPKN